MKIDRQEPFDLGYLRNSGLLPYQGEWIASYHNPNSLAITDINLADIVILRADVPGEENQDLWSIPIQDRINRLDSLGLIAPDAQVFQTIWDNRQKLTDRFKTPEPKKVFELRFLGTLFVSPCNKSGCILWMNYDVERRRWHRGLTGSVFPEPYRPLVLIKKPGAELSEEMFTLRTVPTVPACIRPR